MTPGAAHPLTGPGPVVPAVAGLTDDFVAGYRKALIISAVLAAAGGAIAYATIRTAASVETMPHTPVGP